MTRSSQFDAAAEWQKLVSQWERQVNELSANLSERDEFAGLMNQAAKSAFTTRKIYDDAMERLVQIFHLATSGQLTSVIERLDRVEEQLQALVAASTSGKNGEAAAAAKPRRTRLPHKAGT